MKKESNFRRAYTDLASKVGIDSAAEPAEETIAAPAVADISTDDVMQDILNTVAEVAPAKKPTYTPASITTIAADSVLTGDISAGNLEIFGTISGTVVAKGSIVVRGTVTGNVTADSILVDGGTVSADLISATGSMEISAGSNVSSNIQCGSIAMHGKLTGDLTVSGSCVLYNSTVIEGNLKAASLSVAAGAVLKGLIEISG